MVRNTADPFEEDDPRHPAHGVEAKLKAVREAVLWAFPTAEIAQMLDEIERGGDR